jgi:hypothetical protein
MTMRVRSLSLAIALAALGLATVVACQPASTGGGPTPTPAVTAAPTTAPSPGVTVDGTTVTIVGVGRYESEPFELPAGSATMTISACRSNRVLPFITLTDENGQSAGIIVDPVKVLSNLAGGTYRVSAQANPDCVWQVVIKPE